MHLGTQRTRVRLGPVTVMPGNSLLTLRSQPPPVVAVQGDARTHGECVFGLEFDVRDR